MQGHRLKAGLLGALLCAAAGPAVAASPVVVELFTSQGCSSCPPANANLLRLAERPDVLALSFSVTYWDRLGWKDTFGRPEYTERQRVYEPALGQFGPFTPQMVVNGRADAVGNRLGEVEGLIARNAIIPASEVRIADGRVAVGAGMAPAEGADVWLVRYDPRRVEVGVRAGENGGRTLPHKNVVHALERIGDWRGAPLSIAVPAADAGLRTAVLVQARRGGPILAAATD